MPLGKYYCDYCDKQFQDTPFHRKRHLQGIQHQRAKAQWYHASSSSSSSLQQQQPPPPVPKGVCNRFVTTGSCQYGDSCKYYHPSPNQNPQTNANLQDPISGEGEVFRDRSGVMYRNLPPSLRPPPEGGYPPLPFVDWG